MKKRTSCPLSLTPTEIGLGWLYLAAEFLLIPGLIYLVGDFFGGFSPAVANFFYYLTNALCCGLIFRRVLRQSLLQAGKHTGEMLLCAVIAFVCYQILSKGMEGLLHWLSPEFSNVNDDAITAMVAENPMLMLLGTVLLVPIGEECLFRGLILLPLHRKNPALGYAVSALAFAAIHVVGYIGLYPTRTLLLCFLQYLPAGLLLAWACIRSGNLITSMLVHGAVNAASLLLLR